MAAEENVEEAGIEDEQSNGGSNGRNLGRVAALAAASGATAYAAKKALDSRASSSRQGEERPRGDKGRSSAQSGASLVTAAVSSGWDVAKDSLTPIVADVATKAGAYVADRAPELVRDVVVPRFIAGFEKARRGKRGDDESED